MALLRDIFKSALTNDLLYEISLGNIPGCTLVRKFFENSELSTTPEELWEYGLVSPRYTYTANAGADYYIFSSDNADTQSVFVYILDEFKEQYIIKVNLQGQTPILVNSLENDFVLYYGGVLGNKRITPFKCTRIWRMENHDTVDFAGNVFCTEGNDVTGGNPNNPDDVRAVVAAANNQTLMCQYTIPNQKVGLIVSSGVSISRIPASPSSVTVDILIKEENEVFRVSDRLYLKSDGNSISFRELSSPLLLYPKTDITFIATSNNTVGLGGSFILILFDERYGFRKNSIVPPVLK